MPAKVYIPGSEKPLLDILAKIGKKNHMPMGKPEVHFDWMKKNKNYIFEIRIQYPHYKYLRWLQLCSGNAVYSVDDENTPEEYQGYYFVHGPEYEGDDTIHDFIGELLPPIEQYFQSLPDVPKDDEAPDYGFPKLTLDDLPKF